MEYGVIKKAVEKVLVKHSEYPVPVIQNWVENELGVRPNKSYVTQLKKNFEFKKGKGKRKRYKNVPSMVRAISSKEFADDFEKLVANKNAAPLLKGKAKAPPFTVKTYRKVDGKAASTEAWTVNVSNGEAVTESLPSVFDVASRVADAIRGADKEVRERAFRWAKESVDEEANNVVHAG